MDYFSHQCDEKMHVFMRDGDDHVQAYHPQGDDTYLLCESAEFRFAEMLNEELQRAVTCPWCDKIADQDHIRKCSGYQKPLLA